MDWEGDPLAAGTSRMDMIGVSLKPASAEEFAGAALEITVTVSGETVDEDGGEEASPAPPGA